LVGRGLDGYAQGVFLFVVAELPPGCGVLGEDDGPLILVGEHVQAVGAGPRALAFAGDFIAEKVMVVFSFAAGAPDFSLGHGLAQTSRGAGQRNGCSRW